MRDSLATAFAQKTILALTIAGAMASLFLPVASAQEKDPTHSPGWVVLSVSEYQNLRARAFPAEHDPEPPPVDATLTRADYDVRIHGELATGHATLTVDVLKEGWVRIPIPAGLLVREARMDGKLLSLVSGGNNGTELSAVLSHPGRSVLVLEIALPVTTNAGNESLVLPATASGVTRASVTLPRREIDMKLTGGLLAEKSSDKQDISQPTAASDSKWIAYGHGNEPLTFTWRRRIEDHRSTEPLRLRGSLIQLLGLGEDSTSISAEINLEVVQGAASEAHLQVPDQVTINQVQGATVADWEVRAGELAVKFLEPVEQSARFVVTAESHLPRDGTMNIPLLRLLETERDSGGVAVEVLGAGEIKGIKTLGLENADATDLGELVSSRQSPSLIAFRFRAGDAKTNRSLSLNVARYTQQAVLMAIIEEARYQVLMSNQGKTLIQAGYAIRNNQRNFLKVTLPPDAVLWSASLAGKPIRPGQSPDGSLLLPLEKSRAGEEAPVFVVELLYVSRGSTWDEKGGHVKLALPTLDLQVSRTGVQLYHPPLFKVTAEPGTFRTETYENPISTAFYPAQAEKDDSADDSKQQSVDEVEITSDDNSPAVPPDTQTLVDKYLATSKTGRASGILPIQVAFPAMGPSLFLVSELTSENQPPTIELTYQHDKKGVSR